MRISDWSSDVCSSDLHILSKQIPIRTVSNRSGGAGWPRSCGLNTFGQAGFMAGNPPTLPMTQGYDAPYRFLVNRMAFVALGLGVFFSSFNTWRVSDRKSVVEGKRVSVRVDIGGGRIFKKKRKHIKVRTIE